MDLVRAAAPYLASYVHALEQGWSPDNMRPEVSHEERERIAHDPASELTSDATNIASRRVIEANGGVIVESFAKPAEYGAGESLRFRILL